MVTFIVALVAILPKDVTTKSETDGHTFGSYQGRVTLITVNHLQMAPGKKQNV